MENQSKEIIVKFPVAVDELGVIDGRSLAMMMMSEAFALLVPYVGDCQECAVSLFLGVGRFAISELLKDGQLPARVCVPSAHSDEETQALFEAHRLSTEDLTTGLLEAGGPPHQVRLQSLN